MVWALSRRAFLYNKSEVVCGASWDWKVRWSISWSWLAIVRECILTSAESPLMWDFASTRAVLEPILRDVDFILACFSATLSLMRRENVSDPQF